MTSGDLSPRSIRVCKPVVVISLENSEKTTSPQKSDDFELVQLGNGESFRPDDTFVDHSREAHQQSGGLDGDERRFYLDARPNFGMQYEDD